MTLVELTVFLAVAIVVAALFASIFLVIWRRGAAPTPDHVPIRLGVILLGALGLTCIGGLFYLSNTPDLSKGSDQSSRTAQTPGEMGLLQAQAQQGVTESVVTSTNEVVKNASTDASTLGVSNQIVGLLGTIAGASVAGIAGLLVGPGRTEQPPSSDGEGTGGGGTSPPTSPADLLREWAKLRDEGIITDGDFNRMKERLLSEEVQKPSSASEREQKSTVANGGDTTPPQVRSTHPRDKADDVPPDIHPTAAFSKDMDGATINPNTFKLLDMATREPVLAGPNGVNYDEPTKMATFTPADPLQNGRVYEATITAGVKDKAGNALAQDKTWHFTVAVDGEADGREEKSDRSQRPNELDDAGSADWTLPLQVSVRLGQPSVPSADVSDLPVAPPPGLTSSAMNTRIGVEPSSDRGEMPHDSQELREALSELEEARSRTYYDEQKDHRDREAYYAGLSESLDENDLFERLSELLRQTHANQPRYQPSKYVYPWVDLHPNLKLQSVYSRREFSAEELIREDFRIDRERTARLQELFSAESALGAERVTQEIDALEESLPYNCEHVVPQSWFDAREPMRGDLHHLFACESGCNSFRSNIPYFDFADFEEVVRNDCGKREENKFEPTSGKGAVARATLYFLLRYPGEINRTSQEYELDRLETLLGWHQSNPVTDYERHRNMAIFEQQGNRNPLIDFPEWEPKIEFRLGLG